MSTEYGALAAALADRYSIQRELGQGGIATDMNPPRWLADGNLLISIVETARTLGWYLVPSTGGMPVRLGSPPRYPADYRFSQDGRRILMMSTEQKSDIFLMRNFGLAPPALMAAR